MCDRETDRQTPGLDLGNCCCLGVGPEAGAGDGARALAQVRGEVFMQGSRGPVLGRGRPRLGLVLRGKEEFWTTWGTPCTVPGRHQGKEQARGKVLRPAGVLDFRSYVGALLGKQLDLADS